MRSRYSAYAVGAVDYLIATTDPTGPHFRADRAAWAEELERYCAHTRFEKLTVRSASADEHHGEVCFVAKLAQAGEDLSFAERSRFNRVDGRWLYHSGEIDDPP